ncbi:MAG: ketopantoate reductase family protein [Acidimicrobiia bacterium]
MTEPRVLVAGVGAIGGWILARLTEHGADVAGWSRGTTYRHLASGKPLRLESPDGDWAGRVHVVDAPDGAYDLVLVTVKSQDTPVVAPRIPVGARVVSAQNGVENPEVLARFHSRVDGCVVMSGCERVGPTHVRNEHAGGHLVVEDAELAGWLDAHGVATRTTPDVHYAAWRKLLVNVVGNSLTTILRARMGSVFRTPEIDGVARTALEETAAVARAEGVLVTDEDIAAALRLLHGLPPEKTTSTLQDLEAGRPFEVDAITGVVVRKGPRPRHRRPDRPHPRRAAPRALPEGGPMSRRATSSSRCRP